MAAALDQVTSGFPVRSVLESDGDGVLIAATGERPTASAEGGPKMVLAPVSGVSVLS
jgi:hypothetical protein